MIVPAFIAIGKTSALWGGEVTSGKLNSSSRKEVHCITKTSSDDQWYFGESLFISDEEKEKGWLVRPFSSTEVLRLCHRAWWREWSSAVFTVMKRNSPLHYGSGRTTVNVVP
jgi:hypothetical protein